MSGASSEPDKPAPTDAPRNHDRLKLPRVAWNPWLGVLFIVATYYLSQLTAGLLVYVYPLLRRWSLDETAAWLEGSVYGQFCFVLLAEGLMIGALYLFLKHYKSSFKTIGLLKPRARDLVYGLAAVPAYYFIYLIIAATASHFIPGFDVDQEQQIGFDDPRGLIELAVTFVSLVILPPLVEEIMVRGFLYSSLKKALRLGWAAILTSLIFAAAHLPAGGPAGPLYIAAVDTFVLGLVLVYLREKTGSLWAGITLHGVKNGIAFLAIFVFHLS